MKTSRRVSFCLTLAVLGGLSGGLHAQEARARVQGLVTDSSSAVIVGANVTLVNLRPA